MGQLFCADIVRLHYDILLLLCVHCDHNLLIPKISLKNIEFCVFYDHKHLFFLAINCGTDNVGHVEPVSGFKEALSVR